MGVNNKTFRIRTDVGINNRVLNINLDQNYEVLDILSVKLDVAGVYRYHVSDYGVVVGRVIANGGVGVPNAKLSLFIPKNESSNVLQSMLYPFTSTNTKNGDGIKYNLLTDTQNGDCHQVVGTFPSKRLVLDDDNIIEIFKEYYKFTTTSNQSGDYMFFGVPTGTYTLHMDLDISDCGKLSQRPRDFIYKGYDIGQFDNPNKFKAEKEISSLPQIFTQDLVIDVKPFWGDSSESNRIGITREDINISYKFEPTCVFIGSVISDNKDEGVSKKCVPSQKMGSMKDMITGSGRIEIIRKTPYNTIEELQIQGTQLINGNGVWCFQIPMNLDYVYTDEYGNMVPTDDVTKGIPTRCEVRFRISMDESGEEMAYYHRGKVLIPHNPHSKEEIDYEFGSRTKDTSFKSLMWNNVYSIKSFIPRFQKSRMRNSEKFSGIKSVNMHGNNNPMPYNNLRIKIPFMYTLMCAIIKFVILAIGTFNLIKQTIMRYIGDTFDIAMPYSYVSNEFCPDLENWYFAPFMETNPKKKKNDRTCRQWENQSVCKTFKEIAEKVDVKSGKNVKYHKLKDGVFSTTFPITAYEEEETNENAITLSQYLTVSDFNDLATKHNLIVIGYKEDDNGKFIRTTYSDTSISFFYEETPEFVDSATIDKNSIDYINSESKSDVRINLTNNVNYLVNCVETNLAKEYEVIKFDFYNDWINGCIYLPRWAREYKFKKRLKKGDKDTLKWVKGCINGYGNNNGYNPSRRYVQWCALSYDTEDGYKLSKTQNYGCDSEDGGTMKCHKNSLKTISVFGGKEGIVNETKTMMGQNVYYLKPCEFKERPTSTIRVPFFATDIIMLGSLFECNEYGLPVTFDSLMSTSYQLPPQLSLTNTDDGASEYYDLSNAAPTPTEIFNWKCNNKCDKGGKMVTGLVSEEGLIKTTIPSYQDLQRIITEYLDDSSEKVKYYTVTIDGQEKTYEAENVFLDRKGEKNCNILYYDANNVNDDDKSVYYYRYNGTIEEIKIGPEDKVTTYYKIEGENAALEYEDIFPITEMSGIDWGYEGATNIKKDYQEDKYNLLSPGGHFLGLSCSNAETNIKTCANLQRACEIGTSLSSRIEVPFEYGEDGLHYLFIAPNGLISKDQIIGEGFRSAFATMNHNSLKTKINSYGYKEYEFSYLRPDSFDGILSDAIKDIGYTQEVDTGYEDYIKGLEDSFTEERKHEIDIEKGKTIIRNTEIRSNDYINFRLGQDKQFLINFSNFKAMPVYENSFYFYFGLKNGETALDVFKQQFYAPCDKNIIINNKKNVSVGIDEKFNGKNFDLTLIIEGLTPPIYYKIEKLTTNDYEVYKNGKWELSGQNNIIEGVLDNNILSKIDPGEYKLEVSNARGYNTETTIYVGKDYFTCDYIKNSNKDFDINIDESFSTLAKAYKKISDDKGGYIDGTFEVTPSDPFDLDSDLELKFVPVIRRKYTNDYVIGGDILEGEETKTRWSKYYKTKNHRLFLWDDGIFEIWVRGVIYNKNTKTFEYPSDIYYDSIQTKISEFIIKPQTQSVFLLKKGGNTISSDRLLKLDEKYGEWWTYYPFAETKERGEIVVDGGESELYSLYRNIVAYDNNQLQLTFNENVRYFQQIESDMELKPDYGEEGGYGKNIICYNLINDSINNEEVERTPLFIMLINNSAEENEYSNIALRNCKINNGYVYRNNDTLYDNFIKKIGTDTPKYLRACLCNGNLVEARVISNNTIYLYNYNDGTRVTQNGSQDIVLLNRIPVLRKEFHFHYVLILNNGDIGNIVRGGIVNSKCFKNEFDMSSSVSLHNPEITIKYSERAAKKYIGNNDLYTNLSLSIQTNENGFAKGAFYSFEDKKFVVTNTIVDNSKYTVKNYVFDKEKISDFNFLYELKDEYENNEILDTNNKICVEKISYHKDINNTLDIINILWQSDE